MIYFTYIFLIIKYTINENNEENDAVIYFEKRNLKFILNNINNNVDISYGSLSDYMKKIIDQNQLILGIDLGTTYSCAAVMIDNNIIMIRNSLGSTTTPSYISFIDKNEVYVGELAKLLPSNEKNILYNTKRLLGKNIEDDDIKELMQKLSFSLKKDEKYNLLKICLNFDYGKTKGNNEEEFYPEQISALILRKIIKDSEFYLSKRIGKEIKINNCVITVPAYFNQKQRESTYNSAKIIGLNVKTMINEPTAACLAYAFQSLENSDKKMIVIDFGGGTLDITLLRFRKDKEAIYCDVLFTYGNSNFGGEDFDNILMSKCIEKCSKNSKVFHDKNKNEPHLLRLKRACERAKIKLSSFNYTKIHIENISKYKSIDFPINQSDFFSYCKELFNKFNNILDDFIIQSKMNKNEISEVILIGGSTLIPKIREIITEKFKKSKINYKLDPKEVVAMGASISAAKLSRLPSVQDIKLFDVTNLSLGVRVQGNRFKRIIPRSTPIPFHNTDTFKTTLDNQDFAVIKIYEGENDNDCDIKNLLLGKFFITGLPKRKGGEVKIEVKLEIKDNSLLEVTASEVNNPSNRITLIIKKQNDLIAIIDQLKERDKKILFFENEKYNVIKYSILESEDEIQKQKRKLQPDQNQIKLSYKNILQKVGNFLIDCYIFSNLHISFIKIYFNKICEYHRTFNDIKSDDIKIIKETITKIFEKIQMYNREMLFEIIEEMVDIDNIYMNFVYFIMQSLYEEINTLFYTSISGKEMKNKEKNVEELKYLSKGKALIEVCKGLIDKFDKDKKKLNNITKIDLDNVKMKIKVREEIIKINHKKLISKMCFSEQDRKNLEELYKKYFECHFADQNDLIDLGKLLNESKNNKIEPKFPLNNREDNDALTQNGDFNQEEFEKASKFIAWIDSKNFDDDIIAIIYRILNSYPYVDNKKEKEKMWEDFYKYKSNEYKDDYYLLLIRGKYQDKINNGIHSDIQYEVFYAILKYLNKFISVMN